MSELAKNVETFNAPLAERPASIMDIIGRAANDPSFDVNKMERLLALHERILEREAGQKYNEAMTEAQAEMRPISQDAANPQTRSKYASYLALDKALRPLYTKCGFSLSFDTADGAPEGYVRVVCKVGHSHGHSERPHLDMPCDGKGAKGGDVMTKTHATMAALSYAKRGLLKMVFNISEGESDDDGNYYGSPDTGGKINAEQIETIRDMIARSKSDVEKFCKYFRIEAIPDLSAKEYKRAVESLNTKLHPKPSKVSNER